MSRAIKVSDEVYGKLEEIRTKNETRSQVVERLIKAYEWLALGVKLVPVNYIARSISETYADGIRETTLKKEDRYQRVLGHAPDESQDSD